MDTLSRLAFAKYKIKGGPPILVAVVKMPDNTPVTPVFNVVS